MCIGSNYTFGPSLRADNAHGETLQFSTHCWRKTQLDEFLHMKALVFVVSPPESILYLIILLAELWVCNPFSHEIGFCDRSAFSSNSPARMRLSVPIDTPLSSRARALWRSFFLPFYRPTHCFCACLSACSDIYDMSHSIRTLLLFFFFFFFFKVLKG